ncbi:peptidase M14 [Duganella sp. FT134W]|uniref:Peptidase M14 n=1 Tax=Duganella margarita TaxID=2692170 RepID=A0A7X4GXM0_9BURK|nr:M14 family metallopeptidase [Duganella margarita]MYM71478.1 peptidase M14 [Duganella margarita]
MIRSAILLAFAATSTLAFAAPVPTTAPLSTISERSGFQSTGRYDEVIALCAKFQKAYPKQVRCFEFGRTPEGRPMLALAVTRTGALSAEQAKKKGVPVMLIQGGIHAGEIDGKDAGFLALREALEGKVAQGALDKQVLLFVPVFNVDGHERFGKNNRPNQRGPVEMGWRVTAQNYNLNRDYVKADAPEMQAMLALVNAWDPLAYVDLHVTDGAKFQPDVSIQVEPVHGGDEALKVAGTALQNNVMADLKAQGSDPKPYYISFAKEDDPASGFVDSMSTPRFSTGYFPMRNRFAMLVETHSWKDYPTRVRITHNTIVSLLSQVAQHGQEWQKLTREADARAVAMGGGEFPLSYRTTFNTKTIQFAGYEYTREHSVVSGGLWTRYDESKPQMWTVPLRDEVVPDLWIKAPQGGYIVPLAQAAWVGAKLKQHGIEFKVIKEDQMAAEVETFRATKTKFGAQSFEGHQTLTVEGDWNRERRALTKGSLFVPIAQPKARLVMTMLEPRGADGLLAWGEFNNAFERKEYMEDYVAEEVARDQLEADPALRAEFQKKLDTEPDFEKSPQKRLEFFARRHASWDERYNLYPVLRTAQKY